MRKVVDKKVEKIVQASETTINKYYGFEGNLRQGKGFISQDNNEGKGLFKARAVGSLTIGAFFMCGVDATLSGTIEKLLQGGGFEVYEFDTPQELFTWLAVS